MIQVKMPERIWVNCVWIVDKSTQQVIHSSTHNLLRVYWQIYSMLPWCISVYN